VFEADVENEPNVERKCWRLVAPSQYYLELTVEVHPLKGIPWVCMEPFFDENIKSEILTVRNRDPPRFWWHEDNDNRILKTCASGTYTNLNTDMNMALFRLQRRPDSGEPSKGFRVYYHVKRCENHPNGSCAHNTPYPTPAPQNGVTSYPTSQPTRAQPTQQPTLAECADLGDSHDGVLEQARYDNDAGSCWEAARPNGLDEGGSLSASVFIRGVEDDFEGNCHDKLNLFAVYSYRKGKKTFSIKTALFGKPLCGTNAEYRKEAKLEREVEDPDDGKQYSAILTTFRAEFESDHVITGEGFEVEYSWGSDNGRDIVVGSFEGLKKAVRAAQDGVVTFISLNADTIYFDDTWDCVIPGGKLINIKPARGRSTVVFDGSMKTRKGFADGLLDAPVPQICQVERDGHLEVSQIHFRFFKAQPSTVSNAVGMLHVRSGGYLGVGSCRFSSIDARPYYTADEIAAEAFPKGALIQSEPEAYIVHVEDTHFNHNLHTPIANRGRMGHVVGCNFSFNQATAALDATDGTAITVPGALLANSRRTDVLSECSFQSNVAASVMFENSRRTVDPDQVFVFNPEQ